MRNESKPYIIRVSEEQVGLLELAAADYGYYEKGLKDLAAQLNSKREVVGKPNTKSDITALNFQEVCRHHADLLTKVAQSLRHRGLRLGESQKLFNIQESEVTERY